MIETRPTTHARTKSRATLNGILLAITDLNPFVFAKLLRERQLKGSRRERLERAAAALKAVTK